MSNEDGIIMHTSPSVDDEDDENDDDDDDDDDDDNDREVDDEEGDEKMSAFEKLMKEKGLLKA